MESVWVFQDLMDGTIRIFAHEDDAKKFALAYFDEVFQKIWDEDFGSIEPERKRFMEDWSADEGMIRLDEVGVE